MNSQTEITKLGLCIDTQQANQLKQIVIVASPKEGAVENPLDYGESTLLGGFIGPNKTEQMTFQNSNGWSLGRKISQASDSNIDGRS